MSAGSNIYKVRFPDALEKAMLAHFERCQGTKNNKFTSLSDFIRDCVRERVGKGARSKASKARAKEARKKQKEPAQQPQPTNQERTD